MRVLLLNYEYPPLGGGAGHATRELARELVSRGVGVDVVTSRADGRSGRSPDTAAGEPGIAVHGVRSWRKGSHDAGFVGAGSYLVSAYPVVRRLMKERPYDVAHFFFSLPTGALLPAVAARGIPTVVSLRGSDVPGYDPTNTRLQRMHRLFLPLTRRVWRAANEVVAVTEGLGRLAREMEPDLRFTVVRNGVDLEAFHPPVRPREGNGGPIRCVAVARLTPRKGHACLLHAFARLPRHRFVLDIVGSGELEPALRRMADELGLGDAVRFHGAVGRAEVAERCRSADLFTLLPEHEAFGNVFAEALASGLAVIGTNVGGIPELVEHGRNGLLVPPDRPEEASDAILRLAEDLPLRRKMMETNRRQAESTLSWSTVADRYLDVYRSARSNHRPVRATDDRS